jgi:cysteine desulfurase/selenocysteine lyase
MVFPYSAGQKNKRRAMINIGGIRADFPILERKVYRRPLVYLDNAATTHKPRAVLDRIMEFYANSYGNVHRGAHYLSEEASAAYEEARGKVGAYINARNTAEIIFTRSTTESINLVADCFGRAFIGEGDEIIISEMEHHSNLVPWQVICERKGAALKVIPFDDDGTLVTDELRGLITARTKLISLTYVSNVLGTVNSIKEIIETAHACDVPVFIDGAQAVQHFPVDVQDLDCDFFAFSGHKIYAETGIGVLYGKEKWLEAMPPYQCGGGMISSVRFEKTTYADLPLKFEAGTNNFAAAVSLAAAIDYINRIGISNIASHEQGLIRYAVEEIGDVDGVKIYGNAARRCGAVSFNMDGIHPYDACLILDKLGVAVRAGTHCAEPVMRHYRTQGCLRASFAMYNKHEEIDELIAGLQKVRTMLRNAMPSLKHNRQLELI